MYPKIFYFAYFENMRKREYQKLTTPAVVMSFFKTLKMKKPTLFTADMDMKQELRKQKHHHIVLGFYESENEEFINVTNKYSHLPFYVCYDSHTIMTQLNLTQNETNVIIYRKPELLPPDIPEFIVWDKNETLMDWFENNYHLDVDVYTHDSKYLYDLHADDVGLIYFAGANTLYHQGFNSPVSKLTHVLHTIHTRLQAAKDEFVTVESKARFDRFTLALAFKQEFWIWSRKLHLKMEMDFSEEFSPIVVDSNHRFYMDRNLANMTMDTLDEDAIYQFYHDYIQGAVEEFKESESIDESFLIGSHWRRRLDAETNGTGLATQFRQVGRLYIKLTI